MSADTTGNDKVMVCISPECQKEKCYIADVLLRDFLGWDFEIEVRPGVQGIQVYRLDCDGRLIISDGFFAQAAIKWLHASTLPPNKGSWCMEKSLCTMIGEKRIPVFYGGAHRDGSWWDIKDGVGELALDVFGSSFFFLSRYEEAVSNIRDEHGRFPSSASISSKWGILDRPVVNEYLEIFWNCAKQIWPDLERKPRTFRVIPSHDIDWPYQFLDVSWKTATRNFLRAIKHGKPSVVVAWSWRYLLYRCGALESDPYHTIRWILDQSDQRGLESAFYYIPQQTHTELDPADYLDHPHVMSQWKMIIERGHEIGVHPGYETFESAEAIVEAANRVRNSLGKLGHSDADIGGRQHFLRWSTPETARSWEEAGLSYDSTLGYADRPGFRCGTCYEYPFYDVKARKPMILRERPLIAMDCSVIDQQYMGLGTSDGALKIMTSLKDTCRKYQGDFTLLWHNQRFASREEQEMYCRVLDH